jgi:hypothetical protein
VPNIYNVALEFARCGLPNVIGTIDGCHIPIKKTRINGNSAGMFSFLEIGRGFSGISGEN